jgi:hypothetical protein
MRIDSDCDLFGTNPPLGTFNVVGIGSQFDTESPYTSGYQLFPRSIFDVQDQVSRPISLWIRMTLSFLETKEQM